MLTNETRLRLKDVASRVAESSDLLPGEEDFLLSMAESDSDAMAILENARHRKLHDGVSGE